MGKKAILLAIVLVIAAVLFYVYFFIISPTFVGKPYIEKPTLAEGGPIQPKHIQWLVNELGAYKLHNPPLSEKKPEIEMHVTTEDKYFAVTIEKNYPTAKEGRAQDPDIRISGSRDIVAGLLASEDLVLEAKRLSDEGKIKLEILRGMTELATMGYKALYDELA